MEDNINWLLIFDNAGVILADGLISPIERNTLS